MEQTRSLDFQHYLNVKGFLNYGIPTAVICLIINYFLQGPAVPLVSVGSDLLITVFLTVFICTLTGVPGIRADIRKGKAPAAPMGKQVHPVYCHFSDSVLLFALQFGIFATLIFGMIPGGILAAVAVMAGDPGMAFGPTAYFIGKSLYCGLFISFSMRWAVSCVLAQENA